jgi:hydrogenase maturation protease
MTAVVIGVGNEYRHDDGAAVEVIGRLRRRHLPGVTLAVTDGEPSRLIDLWESADLAIVVDAIRTEPSVPGRLHTIVVDQTRFRAPSTASSHGLGLGEAVELARTLGRLPARLVIIGMEGGDFSAGLGLSPAVGNRVQDAVDLVVTELDRT